MTLFMLLTSFDSWVEDDKLCTNIECLEGKLKHAAADQISDICIYWSHKLQHSKNMMFQYISNLVSFEKVVQT